MIGADFAGVLAAAQQGDEAAYARLWRDGNPPLLRYLRVVSSGDPEDVAAETWASVVRGLRRFRGEERDWRAGDRRRSPVAGAPGSGTSRSRTCPR